VSVAPVMHLAPESIRPYLRTMTRLAVWADELGYDLKVEVRLTPLMIRTLWMPRLVLILPQE
jgi:hypothetical protein